MSGFFVSQVFTAEWNWMSVCANKDASLTLDDATLTMDGAGAGNVHAIYFCKNNKLNLKNGSNLTIKNHKQDALEWDGGDGGYNVNIESGSTYASDHCRSGFTDTFIVTVGNFTVTANNKQRSHRHHLHWQGRVQERKCSDFWYRGHELLVCRQGAAACRWLDVRWLVCR